MSITGLSPAEGSDALLRAARSYFIIEQQKQQVDGGGQKGFYTALAGATVNAIGAGASWIKALKGSTKTPKKQKLALSIRNMTQFPTIVYGSRQGYRGDGVVPLIKPGETLDWGFRASGNWDDYGGEQPECHLKVYKNPTQSTFVKLTFKHITDKSGTGVQQGIIIPIVCDDNDSSGLTGAASTCKDDLTTSGGKTYLNLYQTSIWRIDAPGFTLFVAATPTGYPDDSTAKITLVSGDIDG